MVFESDQIGKAGAFISIDADGSLLIERGYVRAEDETPAEPDVEIVDPDTGEVIQRTEPAVTHQRAVITLGGQPVEQEEDDETETIKPLPDRLVSELTAHRTLALRDAVAANPHVAMTALLHRLVMDCFMPHASSGCLEAQVREVHLPAQAEDLRDSASAKAIADRHERWGDHVPADDAALWDWLTDLDDGSRMDLLAHCVSYGVNALYEKPNPYSGSGVSQHGLDIRLSQADRLARSTGLDMVAVGWRPTVENYLGRVTKPRILEAVREGAGDRAAELIGHLKKGDMAKEAERLLADTGWLPEPLRMVDDGIDADPTTGTDREADELPDFLSGDGEDDPADDKEEQHMVAAE
jgi:ParB family chromosome partitioning protein